MVGTSHVHSLSPDFLVLQAQKQLFPVRPGEDSSKGKRQALMGTLILRSVIKTNHQVSGSQSFELRAVVKEGL